MRSKNRGSFRAKLSLLCVAALLLCSGTKALADAAGTVAILLNAGILSATNANNHIASVNIGRNFNSGDFNSQQDFCGIVLQWFQKQDATVTGFTLYDTTGTTLVGSYSSAGLRLGPQ